MNVFEVRIACLTFVVAMCVQTLASAQILNGSLPFTYDDGNGNTLLYRLYFPPGHDEPGAEFPLVLFMHGSGQIGSDNISQMLTVDGLVTATQSDRYASFLLAPQAQPGQGGWGPLTRQLTLQVMQQIEQQYPIDATRRYVTGLSMGGFGTWQFAADHPGFFEAAAPMSAWGNPADAAKYLDTRVWSFNGSNDDVTPPALNRATVQAVRAAGQPAIYTETSGAHAIWGPIYDDPDGDLYNWMFEGVAPPLGKLIYNPSNGRVIIDARDGPGGTINFFRITTLTGSFSVPSTIVVDDSTVDAQSFFRVVDERRMSYDGRGTDGFSKSVDLGPIFPIGLDFDSLHDLVNLQIYLSPNTGASQRSLDLVIAIPEPSLVMMLCGPAAMIGLLRRGRGNRPSVA